MLAVIWLLLSAAVHPLGDFLLNDDWSFGRPVAELVEEGRFELTGWMSMTFVVQLLWGALFCLPAGFSFTALRLSSLSAGLIGVLATYLVVREAEVRRRPLAKAWEALGPACAVGGILVAYNAALAHGHAFRLCIIYLLTSCSERLPNTDCRPSALS